MIGSMKSIATMIEFSVSIDFFAGFSEINVSERIITNLSDSGHDLYESLWEWL